MVHNLLGETVSDNIVRLAPTIAEGRDDLVENAGKCPNAFHAVHVRVLGLAGDSLQLHLIEVLPDGYHDDVCPYSKH